MLNAVDSKRPKDRDIQPAGQICPSLEAAVTTATATAAADSIENDQIKSLRDERKKSDIDIPGNDDDDDSQGSDVLNSKINWLLPRESATNEFDFHGLSATRIRRMHKKTKTSKEDELSGEKDEESKRARAWKVYDDDDDDDNTSNISTIRKRGMIKTHQWKDDNIDDNTGNRSDDDDDDDDDEHDQIIDQDYPKSTKSPSKSVSVLTISLPDSNPSVPMSSEYSSSASPPQSMTSQQLASEILHCTVQQHDNNNNNTVQRGGGRQTSTLRPRRGRSGGGERRSASDPFGGSQLLSDTVSEHLRSRGSITVPYSGITISRGLATGYLRPSLVNLCTDHEEQRGGEQQEQQQQQPRSEPSSSSSSSSSSRTIIEDETATAKATAAAVAACVMGSVGKQDIVTTTATISSGSKSIKCQPRQLKQQPQQQQQQQLQRHLSSSSLSSSSSSLSSSASSIVTTATSSASTSTTTSTTTSVSTMRSSQQPKLEPDQLMSALLSHRRGGGEPSPSSAISATTSSSSPLPPSPPPLPPHHHQTLSSTTTLPLSVSRSIGLSGINIFPSVSRKTQTREMFKTPQVRSMEVQTDLREALRAFGINTDIDMDLMTAILDKVLVSKASVAIQTEDTLKHEVKIRKCRDASVGTEKFSRERFSALPDTRSKYTQTESSWLRTKTQAVSTEDNDLPLPVTLQSPTRSPSETRRARGIVRIVRDRPYKLSKNIQTDLPVRRTSEITPTVSSSSEGGLLTNKFDQQTTSSVTMGYNEQQSVGDQQKQHQLQSRNHKIELEDEHEDIVQQQSTQKQNLWHQPPSVQSSSSVIKQHLHQSTQINSRPRSPSQPQPQPPVTKVTVSSQTINPYTATSPPPYIITPRLSPTTITSTNELTTSKQSQTDSSSIMMIPTRHHPQANIIESSAPIAQQRQQQTDVQPIFRATSVMTDSNYPLSDNQTLLKQQQNQSVLEARYKEHDLPITTESSQVRSVSSQSTVQDRLTDDQSTGQLSAYKNPGIVMESTRTPPLTGQRDQQRSLRPSTPSPIHGHGQMILQTGQIQSNIPTTVALTSSHLDQVYPPYVEHNQPYYQHYQQQQQQQHQHQHQQSQQVPVKSPLRGNLVNNQPSSIQPSQPAYSNYRQSDQDQPTKSTEASIAGEAARVSTISDRPPPTSTTDLVPSSRERNEILKNFTQQLQTHSKVIVSVNKNSQREVSEVSSITTMDRDGKLSRKTQVSTSRKIPVFTRLNTADHLDDDGVDVDDDDTQSTVTQPVITSPTLSKGTFPSTPASPLGKKYCLSESSTRPSSALDNHYITTVSTRGSPDQHHHHNQQYNQSKSTSQSALEPNRYYTARQMNEIESRIPSSRSILSPPPPPLSSHSIHGTSSTTKAAISTNTTANNRLTDPLHIVISEPTHGMVDDVSLPSPPQSSSASPSPLRIRYPSSPTFVNQSAYQLMSSQGGDQANHPSAAAAAAATVKINTNQSQQSSPTRLIHANATAPIMSRRNVHGKPPLVGITWEEASSSTICSEMSTEPFKDTSGTSHRPKAVSVSTETIISSTGKGNTKVETRSRANRRYANNAIMEPDIKSETIVSDSPPYGPPVTKQGNISLPPQSSLNSSSSPMAQTTIKPTTETIIGTGPASQQQQKQSNLLHTAGTGTKGADPSTTPHLLISPTSPNKKHLTANEPELYRRQRNDSAAKSTGERNLRTGSREERTQRKLGHYQSLSATNLFTSPHSIVNNNNNNSNNQTHHQRPHHQLMHHNYPPAPPSYTTSPDPLLDSTSSRSPPPIGGLGYFQPSYMETHLPTFRDDMNLRNLRDVDLSVDPVTGAKSQQVLTITSPQPSVDSGLKVDGCSSDDFTMRSNVESRESVEPMNADSRPISRVTSNFNEMDSQSQLDSQRPFQSREELKRDNDGDDETMKRALGKSTQSTSILPKDLVNNQSDHHLNHHGQRLHQQQSHQQQLRPQAQQQQQLQKAQPGETEITTSITKTTIPEETEPDGSGGLKVKRPAMSRLVLEQLLQSGESQRKESVEGGERQGRENESPIDGDGCTISSSITLESPYRYQNKMASMRDLTYLPRKGGSGGGGGVDEVDRGEGGGIGMSRMKSAASMDSIPKKRSKSCHSYTFGGSTPGIGSSSGSGPGGGEGKRSGGEVITTSKFEKHKSPRDGRGREETTWEYSMECNCVNGVNTSLRTSVRHKRTYLPFACTMYESSV